MHGIGNDGIIIDARITPIILSAAQIQSLCDRTQGVGADQLVVLEKSRGKGGEVYAEFYNPDGTVSGTCGNVTRCVADLLLKESSLKSVQIETGGGVLTCWAEDEGLITVDMGEPKLAWPEIPLSEHKDTLHLGLWEGPVQDPVAVNMGNPHCVFFVKNLADIPVAQIGPRIETHALFPQKTNVEFAEIYHTTHIRFKVWERGAGITKACGSGACAVLVAAVRRGLTERKAKLTLDGGDLVVEWRDTDNHVLMTGSATFVFKGEIDV